LRDRRLAEPVARSGRRVRPRRARDPRGAASSGACAEGHALSFASWQALYASDAQAVYALCAIPIAFLIVLAVDATRMPPHVAAVEPRASAFLRAWAVVFTVETIVDPIAGGPLLRWLGVADRPGAMAVVFLFVLLGDFRVFALIFGVVARHAATPVGPALAEAAAWTFVVPVATVIVHRAATAALGPLPSQALWLIYELGFLVVALVLWTRVIPARVPASAPHVRAFLRAAVAYVIAYYALWALADVLTLATGADVAWALRMIPNQLYYALWVPFVYWLAFARRYAATSSSTQASR
jgi:hypothetical protein